MVDILHYEDFEPGQLFVCGQIAPTRDEIIAFGRAYDPQPFHLDDAGAAGTPYAGVIASGWHTCGMFMRLAVDGLLSRCASMGSPGVDELRWLKPVYPGDRLEARMTVVERKESRSRPDRGMIRFRMEMVGMQEEPVMSMFAWVMMRRKTPDR